MQDSSDSNLEEFEKDENDCAECGENYFKTKETADWIQCSSCSKWVHETCAMYNPMCNDFGKVEKRKRFQPSNQ